MWPGYKAAFSAAALREKHAALGCLAGVSFRTTTPHVQSTNRVRATVWALTLKAPGTPCSDLGSSADSH